MTQAKLPNRPIIFSDETAASVLIRAAEANGHTSVYQLLSGTGIKINELSLKACLVDPLRYRQIIRAIGLGEDAAARALERTGTSRNSPRRYRSMTIMDQCFRRNDASAFCSQCLEEHAYWRQQWLVRPFSACINHKCLLLDCCLECGKIPSIARGKLTSCNHCRASLLTMRGPNINVSSLVEVQRMLDSNQSDSLNIVFEFWNALRRFDGEGDQPAVEHVRLNASVSFALDQVDAINHVATLVKQRLSLLHPRIQLVPFISSNAQLKRFAEKIIDIVPPMPKIGTGLSPDAKLSKVEVCRVFDISPARLADLIESGNLKWPKNGNRQRKVAVAEVEFILHGFSAAEREIA